MISLKQHSILITRVIGSALLFLSIALQVWTFSTPKLTANQRAEANIARMEASAKAAIFNTKMSEAKGGTNFLQQVRDVQKENTMNITIIALILGVFFLSFGFSNKKKK